MKLFLDRPLYICLLYMTNINKQITNQEYIRNNTKTL